MTTREKLIHWLDLAAVVLLLPATAEFLKSPPPGPGFLIDIPPTDPLTYGATWTSWSALLFARLASLQADWTLVAWWHRLAKREGHAEGIPPRGSKLKPGRRTGGTK